MKLSKKLIYTCLTLVLLNFATRLFSQNQADQPKSYKDSSLPIDTRVEDLLSKMSLEEKVAQMRIFHANKGIEMGEDDEMILSEDVVRRLTYGIAGIKNPGEHISPLRAAKLNNQLQKYIIENNRWGIPALFVTESYNGVDAAGCTRFGRPITMASSFNSDLVNRVWDVVGREARLRGMHMCHSPEADIVRDPRFGRMSEAFGEDTYLTTEMIISAVKGVQGDYEGLGKGTHIGAVAKHFAGYGQILGGTNFSAIEISPRTLIDEIYPPFKAAVQDARALGIMASHGDLNGIASHGNPDLLTGVLRDQWGFEGYVVSDANDVGRLHYFMKVAETPEDAAIMGLTAGVDIDLYADDAYALLPAIVKEKPEIMHYIDQAASRVLRTKFILGLFDNPFVDIELVEKEVRKQESLELAKEADLESIILLKNEDDILPLRKGQYKKIALLGPLLKENTAKELSAFVGDGVSLLAEQGFKLTNEKGGVPKLNPPNDAAIKKMVKMAKKADLVLLYLGGDEFTAKEAYFANALGDRADIGLVGQQDELLEKVKALGKPLIVILKHRRTLAINKLSEEADAILDCWDLSEFGDESIGKILFGEVSPSGKLPVTVPRTIGQLPFHYSQKEINYKKEYLFTKKGPLYPFGFGLSYTQFDYSELELSKPGGSADSVLVASVTITNRGERAGKEIVQLYIKDEIGSVVRPDKELKGFKKIQLAPGESQRVSFFITAEMLEFTAWEMEKVLEAGDYKISIGSSSSESVSADFKLTEQLIASIQKSSIEKSMLKAMKWQEAHPIFAKAPTDWTNGAYYIGVSRAHQATGNEDFLTTLREMGVRNNWQPWERFYHADDLAISYAYLYMNKIDPSIVNLQPTASFIDDHLHKAHPWREGIEGKNQQILWWWCDALFMAPPVLTSFAKHRKDEAFLDQMHSYYLETYNLLFDENEHLFARDIRFKWDGDEKDLKEENGRKIFWSRGNGWVLGGLALVLDEMPQDYKHRAFYEQLYLKMAARIKSIQPEDGLWMTSLLSPESYEHGEVSGSGFYTFALAWGINNGLLDKKEYGPVVKEAWKALQACQQQNGKVGWVQNIGAEPKPASRDSWQNYGTGAFLLAGSEILKMK